jgi:hypothetical protein
MSASCVPVSAPPRNTVLFAPLRSVSTSRVMPSSQEIFSSLRAPLASTTRFIGPAKRAVSYVRMCPNSPRTHSLPFESGWSGLPSTLSGRPSRVFTRMPHALWHSRQVEL